MMSLGYLIGAKFKFVSKDNYKRDTRRSSKITIEKIEKFLTVSLVMSIIFNLLFIFIKENTINPITIFQDIIKGISNPSVNYFNKFRQDTQLYKVFAPLFSLSSAITYSAIPLNLYFYKSHDKKRRCLTVMGILFEISRWSIVGTNKGIVDLVIVIISVFFLRHKLIKQQEQTKRIAKRRKISFLIVALAVIFGLNFFYQNINARLLGTPNNIIISMNGASIKRDYPLCDNKLENCALLIYSQSYLTQGYYGMGLAIDEKFEPMFGIGSSAYLVEKAESLSSNNFIERSYINKVKKSGWSPTLNWHTAYTWIANDFSFFGVAFIMMLFGFFFAKIFYNAMKSTHILFIPLFTSACLMIFYLPMNNQLLSNPQQMIGLISLIIHWGLYCLLNKRQTTILQQKITR